MNATDSRKIEAKLFPWLIILLIIFFGLALTIQINNKKPLLKKFKASAYQLQHRSDRLVLSSLTGMYSGEMSSENEVKEISRSIYEHDARSVLVNWKNYADRFFEIRGIKDYYLKPNLVSQLPMIALKKVEYENVFAKIVSFYREQNLDPSHHLVSSADKAAAIYVDRVGGGSYDRELDLIIPNNPRFIKERWLELKDQIARQIGVIKPLYDDSSDQWTNSAKSVEELMEDAQAAAYLLKPMAEEIAREGKDAKVNFGPNSENIIKKEKSIRNKLVRFRADRDATKNQTVASIKDAVRGTLIAKDVKGLISLVDRFKQSARELGWELVFYNYWDGQWPSGYVGIHAKIRIPLEPSNDQGPRWVMAEMQFHLEDINDGTTRGLKERVHVLYEILRQPDNNEAVIEKYASSSMLQYVAAFEEIVHNLS